MPALPKLDETGLDKTHRAYHAEPNRNVIHRDTPSLAAPDLPLADQHSIYKLNIPCKYRAGLPAQAAVDRLWIQ